MVILYHKPVNSLFYTNLAALAKQKKTENLLLKSRFFPSFFFLLFEQVKIPLTTSCFIAVLADKLRPTFDLVYQCVKFNEISDGATTQTSIPIQKF